MRYFCILLCAALLLSLCACTAAPQPTDAPTDPPTQAEPVTEPATQPITQPETQLPETEPTTAVSEEITMAVISEYSAENYVHAAFPVLPSGPMASAAIQNFVEETIAAYCPEANNLTLEEEPPEHVPSFADSDCSLELLGRVTLYTDELLSIAFEGQTYSRDAAYPLGLLFTMNLNPKTGEYIRFADRYVVDKPLYDAVAARATELLTEAAGGEWPEGWGTFAEQICDEASFLTGLLEEKDFCVYFTENGVCINLPVSHALGDYLTVPLTYEELAWATDISI